MSLTFIHDLVLPPNTCSVGIEQLKLILPQSATIGNSGNQRVTDASLVFSNTSPSCSIATNAI